MNASARIVVSEVFEEAVVKKTKDVRQIGLSQGSRLVPHGRHHHLRANGGGPTRRRHMQQLQLGFSGPAFGSVEPSQELIQSSRI